MDSNPEYLPSLVEDGNQDDIKVKNSTSASPSSDHLESELPQPNSKTIKLKFPTTKDGVVIAVPLSYCLPTKPDNSAPKEKKESPSVKKPSKKEAHFEQQFSSKWRCERKQRKSGQWDKLYYHIETGVKCRSLLDIERYEKQGIIPRRRQKEVETQDTKEMVKEMGETEEASMDIKLRETQKGKRAVEENFMEDAHIYQNQSCRDKEYSSDDSERTPSPPWSRTGIIPRFAPKV